MLLNCLGAVATGGTTASSVDWSTLITASSFNGIIDGINDVLPVVIPVSLTIGGVVLVWRFVKGFIFG